MKKKLPLAIALLIGSSYASAVTLTNAGFESSMSGWTEVDPASISSDGYSGSKSLKLSGSPARVHQEVNVTAGTSYTLTAWVKGAGQIFMTGGGSFKNNKFDVDDWTQVSVSWTASSSTTSAQIGAKYTESSDVRFDDFVLTSNSTSTPAPTATPTPTVTPTPSATPTPTPTPTPTTSTGDCANIDFTRWSVMMPDTDSLDTKAEIQTYLVDKEPRVIAGREKDWLTWDSEGCPTFYSPNNDSVDSDVDYYAQGTSSFFRSELRELITEYYNTSPNITGYNLNNWVTDKSSYAYSSTMGGTNGTMNATLRVNSVSTDWGVNGTGEYAEEGRIVVGQIHGSEDEPVKIYYRKLANHTKGSVWITVDGSNGDPSDRITFIGFSDKTKEANQDGLEPSNGIALGDTWSYTINLEGNQLDVTIYHNGNTYTMADAISYSESSESSTGSSSAFILSHSSDTDRITLGSHFDNDWMHFKAGVYNQNLTGSGDEGGSVTFFDLNVSHD